MLHFVNTNNRIIRK